MTDPSDFRYPTDEQIQAWADEAEKGYDINPEKDLARPIWPTRKQYELLHEAITRYGLVGLQPLLSAWDAAPANAREAAAKALRDTPSEGYWRNSHDGANAVLRALGKPDNHEPPPPTRNT